jgi:hypothetical protein
MYDHMHKKEGLFVLLLGIIMAVQANAATINAASCLQSAVQAAIDSAQSGDTIAIPSCAETNWGTSTVTISKSGLTILGQGIGSTILSADPNDGMFFKSVNGEGSNNLRITGIEFRNSNYGVWVYNNKAESIKNLRIDLCKFSNVNAVFENSGHVTGVLDHNLFVDVKGEAVRLFGDDDRTATFPFPMGTGDALFLEDNTMLVNNNFPAHFITSRMGSRYVVRHNTFTYNMASGWSATIDAHGMCEGSANEQRGSFTFEVYDNIWNGTQGANGKILQFRGGQGVVFSNRVTSYNVNTPFLFLDDYRLDSDCATSCYQGCCTSYPCTDQITQTYVWNNTFMTGPLEISSTNENYIRLGRDYWTTPMPGYTPYTYPHPLALSTTPACSSIGGSCCGGSQVCIATVQLSSDCAVCCVGSCQNASLCGNSVCNTGESCTTCPDDCIQRHIADNNPCDGCIDGSEIIGYINLWKANSQQVSIAQLIDAIGLWKNGC